MSELRKLIWFIGIIVLNFVNMFAQHKVDTIIFDNMKSAIPYRIPSIAQAINGDIIALSDYRTCKSDIGFGKVDVIAKISNDDGKTWSESIVIAQGNGKNGDNKCGYGDASVVADANADEILIMLVAGNVPYPSSSRENPNRVATVKGTFDKKTESWQFTEPKDITDAIYCLLPTVRGLFFSSGRICQSRKIKKGKYYRVYAGLCTLSGNFVVYSDDLGDNWQVLGSNEQSCIADGDECKCEELPEGSVVLSSRTDYGRIFNIFHYTDKAKTQGYWAKAVNPSKDNNGIYNTGTACNGEILLVEAIRQIDNKKTYLLLQTAVAHNGRNNVTLYYKEIEPTKEGYLPKNISADWNGKLQLSDTSSAYSTMIQLQNKMIAVYFEETELNNGYNLRFCTYSIDEITNGKYKAGS